MSVLTDDDKANLVMEHLGPAALTGGKMSVYDAFMLALQVGETAVIAKLLGESVEPVAWYHTFRASPGTTVSVASGAKVLPEDMKPWGLATPESVTPLYSAIQLAAARLQGQRGMRERCLAIANARYAVLKETRAAHYRLSDQPFNPNNFGFDMNVVDESRQIYQAIRALPLGDAA